ncbi:16S rRNA (uracil(1498)-N(3))-methyltransferase [Glaciecola punicea]|nr:16S rRNA (uracil(1498)-N(3))-methyltransferase [Glaciecola punicea]OFA32575.1 16S rRNA (uracil(1498)-N(3))-methyltransferase [Glaciecola punicea]
MRIPRFFIEDPLIIDSTINAPTELAHYMHNVLRLRIGTPIVLFNGNGSDFPSEIVDIQKRSASILINAQISLSLESPLHLHLGQGVSKGERMDFALQKSVELGVTEITPIITENCNVKLDQERWDKKLAAWQKLIIGACEQSQRNILPILHQPVTMHQWLGQSSDLTKIILAPGAKTYLSGLQQPQKGFRVVIGPEGGLSEKEIYTATETGYTPVNIGSRILRTETAAIACLAILQAKHGDI